MASDSGNRNHLQGRNGFHQFRDGRTIQEICEPYGKERVGQGDGCDVLQPENVQEIFGNRMSLAELGGAEVVEFLTAAKGIHFIMQNVISEKLLNIVEVEPVEQEASAFDEYDIENGYEEENEPEENTWKVCGEILDRVIKIAIRLLKNSYSQCMKEDIVSLLDYLKFELDTINENQT